MNQIDLILHSFKKREKIQIVRKILKDNNNNFCFELGSAKGTLSYALRELGGKWISADIDWMNVIATKYAINDNVLLVNPLKLPFKDKMFDVVVCIDFLEHINDDVECIKELARIVKLNGKIIISTPTIGSRLILNKIKQFIGLTKEKYGHVREGYSKEHLIHLLNTANFSMNKVYYYSYFLTECIEMLLNRIYIMINKDKEKKRDGFISPANIDEFQKHKIAFKIYKFFYPVLWWVSRLDYLLKSLGAYAIIIEAKSKFYMEYN